MGVLSTINCVFIALYYEKIRQIQTKFEFVVILNFKETKCRNQISNKLTKQVNQTDML